MAGANPGPGSISRLRSKESCPIAKHLTLDRIEDDIPDKANLRQRSKLINSFVNEFWNPVRHGKDRLFLSAQELNLNFHPWVRSFTVAPLISGC